MPLNLVLVVENKSEKHCKMQGRINLRDFDYLFEVEEENPRGISFYEEEQYMLNICDRLKLPEETTFRSISGEAVEYSASGGSLVRLVLSNYSFKNEVPESLHVKDYVEVIVDGNPVVAPVFQSCANQWTGVVEHHEKRLKDLVNKLDKLGRGEQLKSDFRSLRTYINSIPLGMFEGSSKAVAIRQAIFVSCAEDKVIREIRSLGLIMNSLQCEVDSVTDGLWIHSPSNRALQKILEHLGSERLIPNRRYKFNSQQVNNLIKMLFSVIPDLRALAKLDLMSELQEWIINDITRNPGKVLEIVCAEAMLCSEEILYLVFPKMNKSENRKCLRCNIGINLKDASWGINHGKCAVVDWLTQTPRFKYDDKSCCLSYSNTIYLTPEKKTLLVDILKMHAQYTRDVVKQIGSETIIWVRDKYGRLLRTVARSQNEEDVIGSYAWRRRHGLVSP